MSVSEDDDSTLLSLWASRSCERSFRILVGRYAGLVHQVALRCTGDETIAVDAAQATFILLARKAGPLVRHGALAGWLHVTALNQARTLQRSHMREFRKRRHFGALEASPDTGVPEDLKHELDVALAGLSAPDREALLLRYYRAHSVREVAARLGVSVEAAQQRLSRATERLRLRLASRNAAVPAATFASALAGLAADARAGAALAPSLAAQVLSGAAFPSFSFTLLSIIMTKKIVIPSIACLFLIGVAAYEISRVSSGNEPRPASPGEVSAGGSPGSSSTTASIPDASSESGARRNSSAAWPDLVERYGESRVNLANHLGKSMLAAMDAMAVSMEKRGEYDERLNIGWAFLGSLVDVLKLDAEQLEKIEPVFQKRRYEQHMALRKVAEELRKDPRYVTEVLLASDAFARNRISREEYDEETARMFRLFEENQVARPVFPYLGAEGRREDVLADPAVRQRLREFLAPEQDRIFTEEMAKRDAGGFMESTTFSDYMAPADLMETERKVAAADESRALLDNVMDTLPETYPGVDFRILSDEINASPDGGVIPGESRMSLQVVITGPVVPD